MWSLLLIVCLSSSVAWKAVEDKFTSHEVETAEKRSLHYVILKYKQFLNYCHVYKKFFIHQQRRMRVFIMKFCTCACFYIKVDPLLCVSTIIRSSSVGEREKREWVSMTLQLIITYVSTKIFPAILASVAAEIQDLNDRFMAFYKNNNMKGLSELYTEDCKLMPPGTDVLNGRACKLAVCKTHSLYWLRAAIPRARSCRGRVRQTESSWRQDSSVWVRRAGTSGLRRCPLWALPLHLLQGRRIHLRQRKVCVRHI